MLAQGKYHTWVRRDGEARRHDGEEKVRVNGCSRSFCVCTRGQFVEIQELTLSRGRRGRRRERKESVQGCSSSSLLLSNPLFHPQWNSARAWQDLSGCLPLPCRCYKLEHSRSAKWGDWSQLDLWFLDHPPTPPTPRPPATAATSFSSAFPSPSSSLCHPVITPSTPTFSTFCSRCFQESEGPINSWFVGWFASGGLPRPLQPFLVATRIAFRLKTLRVF